MQYKSLRSRRVFRWIYSKGSSLKGKLVTLRYCDGAGLSELSMTGVQMAIAVSKKVSTRAVDRNLWKRRIREAFRHLQNRIKPSVSIMIQSKPTVEPPSYRELLSDLSAGLQKAGCFQ